jgi:hypothetical protein
VAAFRATLEEVLAADLVIHVRDISHPDTEAQQADVEQVLKELGMMTGEGGAPMIEAWNKIDLFEPEAAASVRAEAERREEVIVLSAESGEGVDDLLACAAAHVRKDARLREVTLGAGDGEGNCLAPPAWRGAPSGERGAGDAVTGSHRGRRVGALREPPRGPKVRLRLGQRGLLLIRATYHADAS